MKTSVEDFSEDFNEDFRRASSGSFDKNAEVFTEDFTEVFSVFCQKNRSLARLCKGLTPQTQVRRAKEEGCAEERISKMSMLIFLDEKTANDNTHQLSMNNCRKVWRDTDQNLRHNVNFIVPPLPCRVRRRRSAACGV